MKGIELKCNKIYLDSNKYWLGRIILCAISLEILPDSREMQHKKDNFKLFSNSRRNRGIHMLRAGDLLILLATGE